MRKDTHAVFSSVFVLSGNQNILLNAIAELSDLEIIVDGHFVIPNLDAKLEAVPMDFFKKLPIELMVLLTDDPEQIAQRTFSRDARVRSSEDISSQQDMEKTHAKFVAESISVHLLSVAPNHAGIEAVSKYFLERNFENGAADGI